MSVDALPPEGAADESADLRRQIGVLHAELAQARQAVEDLNYAISHDLRAPLRHVRAYLQIVEEDFGTSLAPALRKHLQTVDEAAAQASRMVDALLELSRLRQYSLRPLPVDLPQLVRQVLGEATATDDATARAAPLQWTLQGDAPRLHCDPELLQQVLRRLFSNAAKFTRRQATARVDVSWTTVPGKQAGAVGLAPGDCCEIRIRDNGAGFDPRQADGLCRPFQRLHAVRDFEGLGVGLAYVALALQRMRGDIQIHSEGPQMGCEVVLRLPLSPPLH